MEYCTGDVVICMSTDVKCSDFDLHIYVLFSFLPQYLPRLSPTTCPTNSTVSLYSSLVMLCYAMPLWCLLSHITWYRMIYGPTAVSPFIRHSLYRLCFARCCLLSHILSRLGGLERMWEGKSETKIRSDIAGEVIEETYRWHCVNGLWKEQDIMTTVISYHMVFHYIT